MHPHCHPHMTVTRGRPHPLVTPLKHYILTKPLKRQIQNVMASFSHDYGSSLRNVLNAWPLAVVGKMLPTHQFPLSQRN